MARIGTVIRDVYRRPGAEALPAHLGDRYGIVPRPEPIADLARRARAALEPV